MTQPSQTTSINPKALFDGIHEAYTEEAILEEVKQYYEHLIAESEAELIQALRWGDWGRYQAWLDQQKEALPHPALERQAEHYQSAKGSTADQS